MSETTFINLSAIDNPHDAMQDLDRSKLKKTEESVSSPHELPSEPDKAITAIFAYIDEVSASQKVTNKPTTIKEFTTLLRTIANGQSPDINRCFRTDPHFKDIGLTSSYLIQNLLDRDIHARIIAYFQRHNIPVTEQDRQEITEYFGKEDIMAKKQLMESYAHNGVLTLKSAVEKGVLKETSSTPGDFSSDVDPTDLLTDEYSNIRGYEVQSAPIENSTFYGSNSFFEVVLERGGEAIDRASHLPKVEVQNRARASIFFVIKAGKLSILRRNDNIHKEDLALNDIPPEVIDYIIVDSSNFSVAQEAFGHLPVKIRSAEPVTVDLDDFYEGPYTVPDYKKEVEDIVQKDGAVWCHIARLPVETYPSES